MVTWPIGLACVRKRGRNNKGDDNDTGFVSPEFNTYFHYYLRFPLRLYSRSKNDKRWLHGKGC